MRLLASIFAIALVYIAGGWPAQAQTRCKTCADQQKACMKNYAGPTCKSEYRMCLKSCGKKS